MMSRMGGTGDYRAGRQKAVVVLSLLTGAIVWGMVWYPYRVLQQAGVSGLPATMLTYLVALLVGAVWLFPVVRQSWRAGDMGGKLLLIGLAGGGSNLGYVLATLHGEVMRVLLLFYLAPLWTVLLARLLLGERLTGSGGWVVALSLGGAVVMLWHPESGLPWPASGAEWLGLGAGFLFSLANVLVRQMAQVPVEVKSLAVFFGAVLLGALALPFENYGLAVGQDGAGLLAQVMSHAWLLLLIGGVLMTINLIVQFGLTHTAATQAVVIFLFELVVAAVSSWLLVGEMMRPQEWLGGAMIVAASLFSGRLAADEANSREGTA